MRHLLVTNDFPPKVGGIQSYLWELWRRLPPEDVTVLTTPYPGAAAWDGAQAFRVVRTREPVLLPSPLMTRRVRALAAEVGAEAVVIDPALPLGMIGPSLGSPYAVVLHGAEVTVPARLPGSRRLLAKVLAGASLVVAAGGYPEEEARHAIAARGLMPPVVRIPPGVDLDYLRPVPSIDRYGARARLGLPTRGPLVLSVSRLVPRKGMDTLVDAAVLLRSQVPDVVVAIAGAGRERASLERQIRQHDAPVRMLGKVSAEDLPDLYASADVFVLCCRTRWAGLEQEGFGIVLLEAAAAGVPVVAGSSGGSAEAVLDGVTGIVVDAPGDPTEVAAAVAGLLADSERSQSMGAAGRSRAEQEFSYDHLARKLATALEGMSRSDPA